MNGESHIDAESKKQLTVDNIIVQFVPTKVIDEEGRLSIDFIGEGKGLLFFKGGSEEIIWKKEDMKSRTVFYYQQGDRIALIPGNLWLQIVPNNLIIQY